MEGDRNTKHFHNLASHRRRCNYIDEMQIGDDWVSSNENLRDGAIKLFQQLYTEEFARRLKLDGHQFKQISEMSMHNLEEKFSEEEILVGLRSCNDDRAPGQDGFNMKFLQEFWPINNELVNVFKELQHSVKFFEIS